MINARGSPGGNRLVKQMIKFIHINTMMLFACRVLSLHCFFYVRVVFGAGLPQKTRFDDRSALPNSQMQNCCVYFSTCQTRQALGESHTNFAQQQTNEQQANSTSAHPAICRPNLALYLHTTTCDDLILWGDVTWHSHETKLFMAIDIKPQSSEQQEHPLKPCCLEPQASDQQEHSTPNSELHGSPTVEWQGVDEPCAEQSPREDALRFVMT